MKKALTIVLAAVLLLGLLAACGGGNKAEGTYVVTKLADWTVEEYADIFGATVEEVQEGFKIELKSGGKAIFNFGDEEEGPTEVNWKLDGEKLTLSADGESMTGTLKDGVLTLDFEGEIVEFTKKK